ncbi:MAG: DUF2283 domain-containing protein [Candidatus Diapherotrites archaeon]
MKFEYSPDVDILLIRLKRKRLSYGDKVENFILHYDKSGEVAEIEILEASKTASKILETVLHSKKVALSIA